jgi:hypothetical protein
VQEGKRFFLLLAYLSQMFLNRDGGLGMLLQHLCDARLDVTCQVGITSGDLLEAVKEDVVDQAGADSKSDVTT